ncbi:MAG: methylmalonyl Co-A mutase-associated GTPase MeaB [Burkholderiales bacterium]
MSAAVAPLDPRDAELARGVAAGERRALARAITLTESTRADHRARADQLLNHLLARTGGAVRVGVSGVPGVGKSTFVEALGMMLIGRGLKVAVLAVDPSSVVSGGSILGDKTRMERLSVAEYAFIRPSPASGTLGGVAAKTREAMLLCEAAGYDVVIVETVGVGQSETAVADMTDVVVLLQLPNAGDELQAIKKGVMEIASLVVINKADTDPEAATRAQHQIVSAFRTLGLGIGRDRADARVLLCSALKGVGVDALWAEVERWVADRRASGEFDVRRRRQATAWMWDLVQSRLMASFRGHPAVRAALPDTLAAVGGQREAATAAARRLLELHASAPPAPPPDPAGVAPADPAAPRTDPRV